MKIRPSLFAFVVLAVVILALLAAFKPPQQPNQTTPTPGATGAPSTPTRMPPTPTEQVLPPPPNATLIASGLDSPRGMAFGPDGALYVADAGIPPPPNLESVNTGSIKRIAPDGTVSTITDNIATTSTDYGGAIGASSIAFIGDQMYVSVAGPNGGRGAVKSGIYHIKSDGIWELVADLGDFNDSLKAQTKEVRGDYDRANPYDMVAVNGKLYISDGNVQVLNVVDPAAPPDKRITRLADLSVGHPVLTGIDADPEGNLYLANFTPGSEPPGSAKIIKVTPQGEVSTVATGLTRGTGLARAPDGSFYVAEFGTVDPQTLAVSPPGRIVHVTADGKITAVVEGLVYPTDMAWGKDGLYFTNYSIVEPPDAPPHGAIYKYVP